MGYPDLCLPLPRGADDEMRAELCQDHTARLLAWIAEAQAAATEPRLSLTPYNGTCCPRAASIRNILSRASTR